MELAYIIYPDKSREDTRTLHREMIIKHLDLDCMGKKYESAFPL